MCADLYSGVLQSYWDYRFVKPFSWVVSVSSGAGKTQMLLQFIKECQQFGKYIDTEFMKEPGVPTVSQL